MRVVAERLWVQPLDALVDNWVKNGDVSPKVLWLNDGQLRLEVERIPSSLSVRVDLRTAAELVANQRPVSCFQGQTPGVTKGYVIDRQTRDQLLGQDPASATVIHPFLGGRELLHDTSVNRWVIDIPVDDLLEAETRTPGALAYLRKHVLPERQRLLDREKARNASAANENPSHNPETQHHLFMSRWWQLWRRRSELLDSIASLDRYLATSRVSSARRATVLTFVDSAIHPGDSASVFALDDDYSLGILSSSPHGAWFEGRCSTLKGDLRYTPSTVWDSFPWPQSPGQRAVRAVAEIGASILELREQYLDQGVSLADQYDSLRTAGKSKLRTLHAELDRAVLGAYGFNTEDDVLTQLLALNQDIAAAPEGARGPGADGFDGVRLTDHRIRPPVG